MVRQFIYKTGKLPVHIKWQVLSFLRIQWPEGFQGKNRLRNWITKEDLHPVSFVRTENNLVLSYAEVVWKELKHCGIMYKTYGLTGIFTYPTFRKEGHGLKVVIAAKEYIDEQKDGDIVLFTSVHRGFYEKAGFTYMSNIKLLEGNPKQPKEHDENLFMLFLSEKGKAGRRDFETKPIYFGEDVW